MSWNQPKTRCSLERLARGACTIRGIFGFGHQKMRVRPASIEMYQIRPIFLRNFLPAFRLTVFSANIVARTVVIALVRYRRFRENFCALQSATSNAIRQAKANGGPSAGTCTYPKFRTFLKGSKWRRDDYLRHLDNQVRRGDNCLCLRNG